MTVIDEIWMIKESERDGPLDVKLNRQSPLLTHVWDRAEYVKK